MVHDWTHDIKVNKEIKEYSYEKFGHLLFDIFCLVLF